MPEPVPELRLLEALIDEAEPLGRAEVLTHAEGAGLRLPVYGICFGSDAPEVPTLLVVGGVHGLERIGSEVALACLTTFVRRLAWDQLLRDGLDRMRVAFVPLLNPVGMALGRRSNGRGVDLMRNAPPHPDGWGTPLVGGQRISPLLPWYMGPENEPMQPEARALVGFADRHLLRSPVAVALDCHSGFGMIDRLWFPYARTRRPFPHLPEMYALAALLDRTLPNHVYRTEPQAQAYTIQGDLWDHLYDAYGTARPEGTFLPLTLEMGSWSWVRKNPRQLFSALGSFNPIKPHRRRRALRRHLLLFDFLVRAVASPAAWCRHPPEQREALRHAAFQLWYGR